VHDDALHRAVAGALEGALPPILRLFGGGASYVAVMITSVRRRSQAGGGLALVFANDSVAIRPLTNGILSQQFGLTLAEARTAAALTEGLTPTEISARFGVSIETIRTQLKQAMVKCDARSQAQLVARIAASLAALQRQ
jgi:DNA-binding CsgD family transcriptional regulator